MLASQLAVAVGGINAGFSLYVDLVDKDLQLDDKAYLTHFQSTYARKCSILPFINATNSALGIYQWYTTNDPLWLVGAGLSFANFPYNQLVLQHTHNKLMVLNSNEAGNDSRRWLQNWEKQHWFFSIALLGALGAYVAAVARNSRIY